jgi:hypothetical protein
MHWRDLLIIGVALGVWFVVNRYVLPGLGVST